MNTLRDNHGEHGEARRKRRRPSCHGLEARATHALYIARASSPWSRGMACLAPCPSVSSVVSSLICVHLRASVVSLEGAREKNNPGTIVPGLAILPLSRL